MAGVRVILQDTAGLGATEDPVEREGIRRARRGPRRTPMRCLLLWPADRARSSSAGCCGWSTDPEDSVEVGSRGAEEAAPPWMAVSCCDRRGVDELRLALAEVVAAEVADLGGEVAIAERHRRALESAVTELESADLESPELAAEAVRAALDAVRELTGEVVTEDVLDRIFGSFCIGK